MLPFRFSKEYYSKCVSQIALSQENKLLVILSEAPAQSGTPCHSERRFIEVEESRSKPLL